MPRSTGTHRNSTVGGETVRAFVPAAGANHFEGGFQPMSGADLPRQTP